MCTYYLLVNITLSLDEQVVERAREVARHQGTSLNALIREYVELLAGQLTGEEVLAEFEQLWQQAGDSRGSRFNRDDIYEERMSRYNRR